MGTESTSPNLETKMDGELASVSQSPICLKLVIQPWNFALQEGRCELLRTALISSMWKEGLTESNPDSASLLSDPRQASLFLFPCGNVVRPTELSVNPHRAKMAGKR